MPLNLQDDVGIFKEDTAPSAKGLGLKDDAGIFNNSGATATTQPKEGLSVPSASDDRPFLDRFVDEAKGEAQHFLGPIARIPEQAARGFTEESVSGLAGRKAMGLSLPTEAEQKETAPKTVLEHVARGAGQIVGDLPTYIAGTAAAGGPLNPVSPAGGFALTEGLRAGLKDALKKGDITSAQDFFDRQKTIFEAGGKGGIVGLATSGVGNAVANPTLKAGAEAITMPLTSAGLEGRLPTRDELVNSVATIGALHAFDVLQNAPTKTKLRELEGLRDDMATVLHISDTTPDQATAKAMATEAISQHLSNIGGVEKADLNSIKSARSAVKEKLNAILGEGEVQPEQGKLLGQTEQSAPTTDIDLTRNPTPGGLVVPKEPISPAGGLTMPTAPAIQDIDLTTGTAIPPQSDISKGITPEVSPAPPVATSPPVATPEPPPKEEKVEYTLKGDDEKLLDTVRSEISQGEAGKKSFAEGDAGQGGTQEVRGIPSTFPKYFQNQGIGKIEALRIIDNVKDGKPITERQAAILDDLMGGLKQNLNQIPTGERRSDAQVRKRVDEMSPEERANALLTSDKASGIGNDRAYQEAIQNTTDPTKPKRRAVQTMMDLDSLKWVNDNWGHEVGDTFIHALGSKLKELGIEGYHLSGDEFAAQFDNESQANEQMNRLRDIFKNATITVEYESKEPRVFQGMGFSFGHGPERTSADEALYADKSRREKTGERVASRSGKQPPRLSEVTPEGKAEEGNDHFPFGQEESFALTAPETPTEKAPPKETAKQSEMFSGSEVMQVGKKPIIAEEPKDFFKPIDLRSPQEEYRTAKPPPTFYSQLRKTIDEKMPNAAPGIQVKNIIEKGGVKAEEIQWSGIDDFLKANPGKLTKQQVLDFIDQNNVQVKEVEKTDKSPYNYKTSDEWQSAINQAEARGDFDEAERINQAWEGLDPETGSTTGMPKFHSYQLPGGENYRELLLVLPKRSGSAMRGAAQRLQEAEAAERAVGDDVLDRGDLTDATDRARAVFERERDAQRANTFRSPHFDEPNVLAHIRMNDRTDIDGKKVLFIEEVQSDWAQKGRKEGFSKPGNLEFKEVKGGIDAYLNGERMGFWQTQERATRDLSDHPNYKNSISGIPLAPFVTKTESWAGLAMKRMLRYAAEKGYDRLAWTTGEQQIERYWKHPVVSQAVERFTKVTEPESVRKLGDNIFGPKMSSLMSLDVVDGGMLTALKNNKIFQHVIANLPVYVVDILRSKNFSPKDLFRHQDVVFDNLPSDSRSRVADGVLSTLRNTGTAIRTKLEGLRLGGGEISLFPALKASDLNAREVAGLLNSQGIFHLGALSVPKEGASTGTITKSLSSEPGREFSNKLGTTKLAEFLNAHVEILHGKEGIVKQGFEVPPGEGMKGFYDKILPDFMNKYAKKWGAKVGETKIDVTDPLNYTHSYKGVEASEREVELVRNIAEQNGRDIFHSPITGEKLDSAINRVTIAGQAREVLGEVRRGIPFKEAMAHHGSEALAKIFGGEMVRNEPAKKLETVHSVDITHLMKESVIMQGQSLFQPQEPYDSHNKGDEQARKDAEEATSDLTKSGEVQSQAGKLGHSAGGIKTLALGIQRSLIQQGKIDLRGQTVQSADDLAALAQVYRDPRYETFRIFYLKDNKIVAHEGLTTRMPGEVRVLFAGGKKTAEAADKLLKGEIGEGEYEQIVGSALAQSFFQIRNRMSRLGADSYYFLHNHPSGDPKPSIADLRLTEMFSEKVSGFKGHVVIDTGKYAIIPPSGNVEFKPIDMPEGDKLLSPEIPHDLLGKKISAPTTLSQLGVVLKSPSGFVTVAYLDNRLKVRAIQEVPATLFSNVKAMSDHIRGASRAFGVTAVAAHSTEKNRALSDAAGELIQNGTLMDVVFTGGESIRNQGKQPIPGMYMGRNKKPFPDRVEEEKAEYNITKNRPKEPSPYEEKKDDWFGNKDWALHKNSVEAANLQDEIKATTGEKAFGPKSRDVDKAIQIYIDTKRDSGSVDRYYSQLTPEQKRIVDLSQNLTEAQKAIADKISESYKQNGLDALEAGVIKNVLDNYAARAWKQNDDRPPTESRRKFGTTTRHAKQRTFDTIIEGWAAGKELAIEGATNNLKVLKDEISKTIEDKNLIKELKATKGPDSQPLISDKHLDGYDRIEHPNFTSWNWAGKAEPGEVYGKNFFVTPDGNLMERRPMYAPKEMAKNLNNILGTSKLKGIKAIDIATKYNAIFKSWILQSSFFHHLAFTRDYMMGHTGKDWNPVKAYKDGLKAIKELDPHIEHLVRNGLTLGTTLDWEEQILRQDNTIFENILDKTATTKAIKDKIKALRQHHADFLFKEYGAGLKARAALIEYKRMLKKHPEMEPNERAKMVATLMNDRFGGLHLGRLGRNPTAQHIFRLLTLAPDWTESNIRLMVKAFAGGSRAERKFYRSFWASVITKGLAATFLANLLLAAFDDDDFLQRFKKAWDAGNFKWLDIDITPIYRLLGGDTAARKYFSIFGHFKDPMKFITQPIQSAKNKASTLARTVLEALEGQDWQGKTFTSMDELFGVDDKGVYIRNGSVHKKGEEKGGQMAGQLTKFGGDARPLSLSQLPSFALSQVRGVQPTQIQNFLAWMTGEKEGFDAATESLGLHISTTHPKKGETMAETDFGKRLKEIKQLSAEYDGLRKSSPSDAEAFRFEHAAELKAAPMADITHQAIKLYENQITRIQGSKMLTDGEKEGQVKAKKQQIEERIKKFNDRFR